MEVAIFRWQVDRWTSTNTHNAQLSTCILGLTGWLIPTDNTLFSVFDLTTMAEKGGVPYTLVEPSILQCESTPLTGHTSNRSSEPTNKDKLND